MPFKPRETLPTTAFTLPATYYTDTSLFERERELFYRRMWVGVGRLEEIPARGAYVTREIAGDSIIVLRADDSEVRAFYNVCRHRGTQLCSETAGRLNGAIQCPYHAWTYDYQGRLIGAPHMDGSPGFQKEEFPLNQVRAGVWDGHVFVNLAASGPSLTDHLAGLPARFAPWRMGELVVAHRIVYDVGANWKLIVQNYNECLHCPTLHPSLNKLSHYLSGENEPLRPTYMGGRMDLCDGVETMSMDGTSPRDPLPGLDAADRRRVYYYSVFPNFLFAPHPDYVLVHTLWPEATNRTRIVCEWLVASGGAREAVIRSVGCDRVLGHDEPPGLAGLRTGPVGHQLARVQAGPVFEPGRSPVRVRSVHRRHARGRIEQVEIEE